MVCPRCKEAVQEIMESMGLKVTQIALGTVETEAVPDSFDQNSLVEKLEARGFELLVDKDTRLIEQIKATIIEMVHYSDQQPLVKNSTYLSKKLGYAYSHLSKVFSRHENATIEKYIILQKIERVKELISYEQNTLSQIASQMGYSSVQHLSNQFRSVTGMSVTSYKKLDEKKRSSLDEV